MTKEYEAEQDTAKKQQLESKIHNAQVDVNYAIYYPLMKPYSSLYPKSKKVSPEDRQDGDQEDAETKGANNDRDTEPKGDVSMWRTVEKAMEEGTLDALRYRKDDMPAPPVRKDKEKKRTKDTEPKERPRVIQGKNRRERRANMAQQDDEDDSEGGFFE